MTLWETIFEWLTNVTSGRPVVQRDHNGPIPPRPFVTAKVTTSQREGQSHVGPVGDDGVIRVQQGAQLTLTIQTFGPQAFNIANAIRNSVEKPSVQSFLRRNGLCYVATRNGPTDITKVVGTSFEERGSFDLQLRTNIEILDDVGFIERVELTGVIPPLEEKKVIGVVAP